MVDNILDLKLVLVICVGVRKSSKLVSEMVAVGNVLRRDKVLGNLNAIVEILDLMRSPRQLVP